MVAEKLYHKEPLLSEFHQVSRKYGNYNCIYIEEVQDNYFNSYWFEFGEYQMFKKISVEDFNRHGIRKEDLIGCGQNGEGIVVYAPQSCKVDERYYRWIAKDSFYNIYEYAGENNGELY